MRSAETVRRRLAAEAIAREAGQVMRRRFTTPGSFDVRFKAPQDYITNVDAEVERLVVSLVAAAFPDDGLISEEGATLAGDPRQDSLWVLDPIDGTANFARGIPHFAVSIALVSANSVELGVIYNPMADELFVASRGNGTSLNGVSMQVSGTCDMRTATIEIGWSMRTGMSRLATLLERATTAGAAVSRRGCASLGIAYVAAGRLDGYVQDHAQSWDVLAALLMVSEAGGYGNNFLANDGLHNGNPVLACAPGLRGALVEASGMV